jgi:hypothetical protein
VEARELLEIRQSGPDFAHRFALMVEVGDVPCSKNLGSLVEREKKSFSPRRASNSRIRIDEAISRSRSARLARARKK